MLPQNSTPAKREKTNKQTTTTNIPNFLKLQMKTDKKHTFPGRITPATNPSKQNKLSLSSLPPHTFSFFLPLSFIYSKINNNNNNTQKCLYWPRVPEL